MARAYPGGSFVITFVGGLEDFLSMQLGIFISSQLTKLDFSEGLMYTTSNHGMMYIYIYICMYMIVVIYIYTYHTPAIVIVVTNRIQWYPTGIDGQ